jgi:hypothetical protein
VVRETDPRFTEPSFETKRFSNVELEEPREMPWLLGNRSSYRIPEKAPVEPVRPIGPVGPVAPVGQNQWDGAGMLQGFDL